MKLEGKKLPDITNVKRVPGIEEMTTKSYGKIYVMKYFLTKKGSKFPVMIGLASKSKSIKPLLGIMVYNLKLIPGAMIEIRKSHQTDEKKLIEFIGKLVSSTKYSTKMRVSEASPYYNSKDYLLENIDFEAMMGALGGATKPPQNMRERFIEWWKLLTPEFKFIAVVYGILFAIPLILKFIYLVKTIRNWATERYVSGPAEQKVNDALFKGQQSDDQAFAMFNTLKEYITHIVNKRGHALIICGPPGMSKTYTVRRTLYFAGLKPRVDYSIEKGASLSLIATYDLLYKNRKRLLVLDDFDTPLTNPDTVNLLKSITDSYDKRILSLPKEDKMQSKGEVEKSASPSKFEYKGQLIIITNLTMDKIDPALLSRAPAFEVKFEGKEIIKALEDLLIYVNPDVPMEVKEEVYAYILDLYKKDKNIKITFRAMKSAVDARTGAPHAWKEMTKVIVGFKGAKNVVENYLGKINTNPYMY